MKAKECVEFGEVIISGFMEGVFEKIICPACGYEMPIFYDPAKAQSKSVFVRCKGRNCKKMFEIKINTK